jgi:MSHA pilin protein MshD
MCIERRRQAGVSLIDAIAAIVVISIAVTAVIGVFVMTTAHSADPMVRQQAQLIAEAYLEEVLLQKFYDPDTDRVCGTPSPGVNEGSRNLFDNVCDYDKNITAVTNGINNETPKNAFGTDLTAAYPALANYRVTVAVTADSGANLNGLTNGALLKVLRIDVTVTGPNGTSITLTGYRTNYNCNAAADPGCKVL